jgi:hypothetical protein
MLICWNSPSTQNSCVSRKHEIVLAFHVTIGVFLFKMTRETPDEAGGRLVPLLQAREFVRMYHKKPFLSLMSAGFND